jgi:hypothetical protein
MNEMEAMKQTAMEEWDMATDDSRSPNEETQDEFVKISANLPASVVKILRQVAKMKGTSMTEVLRHAISLEAFLLEKEREGSKIIVEDKGRKKTQLVVT